MGYVVDKVAPGQVFSEYFGFPCQFSFHRLLHIHHPSSGAGTIGQLVADDVPSGLKSDPTRRNENKYFLMSFNDDINQNSATFSKAATFTKMWT
jgi:hypothetical protein